MLFAPRRRQLDALPGHSAVAQGRRDQVLGRGVLAVACHELEHRLRLRKVIAEPDEALARQRMLVRLAGARDGSAASSSAMLLAQLDDDALGRSCADTRHDLEPLGVTGRDRVPVSDDGRAREHRERHLGPDAGNRDQFQEELALRVRREAVELSAVVAEDQVCEQLGLLPTGGSLRSVWDDASRR